ncbi:tubulin folding cofactor A [Coniosporium apollinis]|uniref:Tubulin-specific chaperone A n=2 Tax=Coniosporium TaxID=2810619 RepID=A0ABQ9NZL2_9PEZI|nr:tubulin folding cofactor A [Cladosporium sp. JES 115]KAJ9667790.1 tubulin folding cofactor A [Coniosporium apollinis]
MAPPSKLAVATSSLMRLVKEEASYHKEMEQQQARIEKVGNSTDENADYQLKQERQALEETKAVLPSIRQKITDALAKLEEQLEANKDAGGTASTEEVTKAKDAVASAKKAIRESA